MNTSLYVYNLNVGYKCSDYNTSLCTFINTSIVNYVYGKNLTSLSTTDNYNLSFTIYT